MAQVDGPDRGAQGCLDRTAKAMLELESRPFKYAGAKQEAIRQTLNMSSTEYHLRLNAVIDSEAALAYAPMLVRRLRRAREGRFPTAEHIPGRREPSSYGSQDREGRA